MLGLSFHLLAALIVRIAFGDLTLKDVKATTPNAVHDDPFGLLIEAEHPEDGDYLEDEFVSDSAKHIKTLSGTLMDRSSAQYNTLNKLHKRESKNAEFQHKRAIIPHLVPELLTSNRRFSRATPVLIYKDVPFEATYDGNSNSPTILSIPPIGSNYPMQDMNADMKMPQAQTADNLKQGGSSEPQEPEKPVSMTLVLENVFPKSTHYQVQNTSEISDDGKLTMNFQLVKQPSDTEFKNLLVSQKLALHTQEWKQNPLSYNILQAHKDKARLDKMKNPPAPSLQTIHASAAHKSNPQLGMNSANLGGLTMDQYGMQGGKAKSTNIRFFPIALKSPTTKSPAGVLHELGAVLKNEGDIDKMDKNKLRNLLVKSALSLINQDVLDEAKLLSHVKS